MDAIILSDVHANVAALEGVLAVEPDADCVVFLGDAVDIGPQPAETVALLRSVADHRVIGNHDRLVLDADPGGRSEDAYERWRQWTHSVMSSEDVRILSETPRTVSVTLGENRVRLHHGDFDPPSGVDEWTTRTTPEADPDTFRTVAERYDERIVLSGHSHRPYVAEVDGTTFVNPGSVGLQRDDMRPDVARYAHFDGERFDLRATGYDVSAVTAAYDDLPLPEAFREEWRGRYRADD